MSTIRERALAEAAALCRVQVRRPPGYGGQWEGYGESMGYKTGPECAAEIEALAKDDPEEGMSNDQEKPEGGVLREEHVDAVIEHGRKVLAGEIPSATHAPLPLDAAARNLLHYINVMPDADTLLTPEVLLAETQLRAALSQPDTLAARVAELERELNGVREATATELRAAYKRVAELEAELKQSRHAHEKCMADNDALKAHANTLKKHVGVGARAMAVLAAHPAASLDALQEQAIERIRRERQRQDEKWGEQNHGPDRWSLILTEEAGEVAKAALDRDHKAYIAELVQVAAVALAALECAARGAGAEEGHAEECQQVYPLALAQMVAGAVWAEAAPDRPIDTERCVAIVDRVLAAQVREVQP